MGPAPKVPGPSTWALGQLSILIMLDPDLGRTLAQAAPPA